MSTSAPHLKRESPRRSPSTTEPAEETPLIQADAPEDSDSAEEPVGSERWESSANQTYNSLDFDEVENELLIESRKRDSGRSHEPWVIKQWVIIIIIGILTAVVAYGIDQGIAFLMKIKFEAVDKYMGTTTHNDTHIVHVDVNGTLVPEERVAYSTTDIPFAAPFFIFIAINMCYVAVAAALVIFGEPVARGSGIGEIKCYLNGVRIFRVVRFKTLVCKAVGILFSVASGLPCGKEGPMIHSGAAIASGIATGKSTKLHCDTGIFREFRNDRHKRNFVTAGAAAGVGAAFGAPVGGLLFAVEEVGSFWSLDLTVKVFVCSAITPWVLQLLLDPHEYAKTSIRGLIDFGKVEGEYNYSDIPFVILLGILGGLIGAAFIWTNIKLTKWRRKYVNTKARRFIEVLFVNGLTSAVLITLVLRGFTCLDENDVLPANRASLKRYGCNPGEYNDMATYFFRSMEESIHVLIHTETSIPIKSLIIQIIPYYFLTILTYGIYVPSGLFLPTLALGASFGHLYAQTWNSMTNGAVTLDPARFAVYGGTAVLGGVVRMTISVVVIIMEATGNTSFFYPLTMITLAAKFVGDKITHGVYEEHIHLNNIPLLDTAVEDPKYESLCAEQVMHQNIVIVPRVVTVAHLKKILRATPFDNALIVIDPESSRFVGLLLRRSAVILIAKQADQRKLELADFVKSDKERQLFRVKKYGIIEEDAEDVNRSIDLKPYMDQWPFTVQKATPFTRVFRTFRELGLRHIVVLDELRKPVGLIGRKQLTHLHPVHDDDPTVVSSTPLDADPGSERIDSASPASPDSPGAGGRSRSPLRAAASQQHLSARGASARGASPTTSMRARALNADELMSSLRTRLQEGDKQEWKDPHIDHVT